MSTDFINSSGVIGELYYYISSNVTGDITLTVIALLSLLVAISFMFRLPMELIAILLSPLIFVLWAFQPAEFTVIGFIWVLYLIMIFFRAVIRGGS